MDQRHFKLAALALVGLMAAAPLAADSAPATDVQDSIEDLRASLGTLANQVNNLQGGADKGIVWAVNVDGRYDYAPYKMTAAEQTGTAAHPLVDYLPAPQKGAGALSNNVANGYIGEYIKRAELEATGKISSWAVWNLQFEFAGLKLEDTGIDAKGLDLLPFVKVPGYEWEVKSGLYRQPFGIENQTGSSSIPFPERAIMDGGYSPASFASATPVKLVYERIMGVQLITSHSYGAVGYKLQAAVGDNQKDQDAGSSATVGAFGGASPASNTYTAATASAPSLGLTTDQDPSEFGRLGIDLNFIPSILTLNVGASALHNSNNSVLLTALNTKQAWQDNVGVDFTLGVPMAQTTFQGEWVAQNSFASSPNSGQFVNRGEGWYMESTTKPLAMADKDWNMLDLNLRIEAITPNVNVGTAAFKYVATSEQASTIGLKWYYSGKTYTSVNYTTYALNGNYTAMAGSSLLSVQQQFNF